MRWKTVVGLLAFVALAVSLPASAHDVSLAGRWAVASGEKTLMVVTLADEDGDGAIDGAAIERPATMSLVAGHASDVAGPVASRSSKTVYSSGDSIVAIFPARRTGDADDVYLVSRVVGDRIGFAIPGYPFPPLKLARAAEATVSADWDATKNYRLDGQGDGDDNDELAKLFVDDQTVRSGTMAAIDWSVVARQDEARRVRVREMLDAGELRTGHDYFGAAFIFQHGGAPDDFLLAHALAMTALAKGYEGAAWIAAATLDRYLQNIGRAQIYGTQFQTSPEGITTQGRYDSALISDAMRAATGVRLLAEQEAQRKMFEEQAQSRATGN